MGLAVRNLAAINYLHSNKAHFFENVGSFKIGDKLQSTKQLEQALDKLKNYLGIAKTQEQNFYADFSFNGEIITTPQEWSRKFLRINQDKNKNNKISVLTNIFHSMKLYEILSQHTVNDQKFINIIKQTISSSKDIPAKDKQKIYRLIEKQTAISFGEVFSKLGYFGKGGKIKQQNFLQEFRRISDEAIEESLKELLNSSIDDIKSTLRVQNSDKLKKIQKLVSTERTNATEKLNKSCEFIKNEMQKTKIFSNDEITKVIQMWTILFNQDLLGRDKRLTSDSIMQVEGKVQELERRITLSEVFIKFEKEDPFQNLEQATQDKYKIGPYKTLVQSTGDNLVKRFRKENGEYDKSESKIDSIFIGKSGKQYKIQEKNSINDMYSQFDSTGDPNTLTRKFGQIKLQSKVKFSTLEQYFSEGKIFSDEELQYLIYLFINFNASNIWSAGGRLGKADGFSKTKDGGKKQTTFKAGFTIDMIDQLMSRGIMAYVSDMIIPDKLNKGTTLNFDNWNFIIFRGQMLIPLSYILTELIHFLEDAKKTLFTLRTYSMLDGISESYLQDVYKQKLAAKEGDPNPKEYDYHWDNLVNVGTEAGKFTKGNLWISGIYLKFSDKTIENLINPKMLN